MTNESKNLIKEIDEYKKQSEKWEFYQLAIPILDAFDNAFVSPGNAIHKPHFRSKSALASNEQYALDRMTHLVEKLSSNYGEEDYQGLSWIVEQFSDFLDDIENNKNKNIFRKLYALYVYEKNQIEDMPKPGFEDWTSETANVL